MSLYEHQSITFLVKPILRLVRKRDQILVCGPLGCVPFVLPVGLRLQQMGLRIQLSTYSKVLENRLSTYTCLLKQHLRGVELGFFEVLIIRGIGWRVSLEGFTLHFSLGYSNKIIYTPKLGIECILYDKQCFKVFGLDLGLVQQTVAELCHLRKYNIYKGKGVCKNTALINLKVSSKTKT